MAHHETKGIQPPAEVLLKLAAIFCTTFDFLVYTATEDKAKAQLRMRNYFNSLQIWSTADTDKSIVKTLIEAFWMRKQLQQLVKNKGKSPGEPELLVNQLINILQSYFPSDLSSESW